MNTVTALYLSAGSLAVLASLPSLRKLIITKRSDELSLTTWTGWLGYHFIALYYAISIDAVAYVVLNILWISFFASMVGLIIYYAPTKKRRTAARSRAKRR